MLKNQTRKVISLSLYLLIKFHDAFPFAKYYILINYQVIYLKYPLLFLFRYFFKVSSRCQIYQPKPPEENHEYCYLHLLCCEIALFHDYYFGIILLLEACNNVGHKNMVEVDFHRKAAYMDFDTS